MDYREDELGRTGTVASLRRLRAAPLSATSALRGTGKKPLPAYKMLGLRYNPDETAEELEDWMPGVDDHLESLEKRLQALERQISRRSEKK